MNHKFTQLVLGILLHAYTVQAFLTLGLNIRAVVITLFTLNVLTKKVAKSLPFMRKDIEL